MKAKHRDTYFMFWCTRRAIPRYFEEWPFKELKQYITRYNPQTYLAVVTKVRKYKGFMHRWKIFYLCVKCNAYLGYNYRIHHRLHGVICPSERMSSLAVLDVYG